MKKERIVTIIYRLIDGRIYQDISELPINTDSPVIGNVAKVLQENITQQVAV